MLKDMLIFLKTTENSITRQKQTERKCWEINIFLIFCGKPWQEPISNKTFSKYFNSESD